MRTVEKDHTAEQAVSPGLHFPRSHHPLTLSLLPQAQRFPLPLLLQFSPGVAHKGRKDTSCNTQERWQNMWLGASAETTDHKAEG